MTFAASLLLISGAWLIWAAGAHALAGRSPREGDINVALAMFVVRLHARLVQRLSVVGRENIPASHHPGPLVVVANHTSGLDPMLIQSVAPFEIKWMMARDMQHPRLEWLWELADVIPVNRVEVAREGGGAGASGEATHRGNDSGAARTAIRHLRAGGVVGVFPEGHITPPGRIGPFAPGVGLLVARSGARVLQVVIDGTARSDSMIAAFFTPSRARLRFLPMREYDGMSGAEIARDLEQRLIAETGWRAEVIPDNP